LREVIIALYSGLRMKHIVGGNGWSPSVAHNLWRPCDEGGEPSILCPCNEGEGDDEELSSTQLLQKLKLCIPQKVNQRTGKQSANNSKFENQSTNDEHNE
jgi:hypothetical protein